MIAEKQAGRLKLSNETQEYRFLVITLHNQSIIVQWNILALFNFLLLCLWDNDLTSECDVDMS